MNELNNIKNNNNGQIAQGNYDIVRVVGINNPSQALTEFKNLITAILKNIELDPKDKKWESLLPEKFIRIMNSFEYEDYRKDDGVASLKSILEDIQDPYLKKWEWYSSKLQEDGFEVCFKGIYRLRFITLVRFLGIPASKIFLIRQGKTYSQSEGLRYDVIEYKQLANY